MRRKKYFIGGLVNAVLPTVIPGLIGQIIGGGGSKSGAPQQTASGGGSGSSFLGATEFLTQASKQRQQQLSSITQESNAELKQNMQAQLQQFLGIYDDNKRKQSELDKLKDILNYG
tara:strand:+ start:1383 stop:1730 length:348 start_codon:yes stop_codon:yes gene_type:complete